MILTIISSVLASSGLWACIQNFFIKRNENKSAVAIALQCLLRDKIIQSERLYKSLGYCDSDEKTNIEHMFKAYENLGGNDVAHKAYLSILELPSEPPKETNE